MKTSQQLIQMARESKLDILKFFYGDKRTLSSTIGKYQKHEINALFLLGINTPFDFSRLLQKQSTRIQHLINTPEYKTYQIRKKNGGFREIAAPEKELKLLQKRLNYYLQAYYLCIKPTGVHGFVVNPHYLGSHCNIAENALAHTGKKVVLNIDLKDFFPGINANRVKSLFGSPLFEFEPQLAIAITLLTTYEGKLPVGAPTSPVISNFICLPLDEALHTYCKEQNFTYTRYADDLTFSSNDSISNQQIQDIKEIIRLNNFEVNERKFRIAGKHRKQTVTGLTVNEKVNVDRKLLKSIRAMLHDLLKNGMVKATQNHFNIDFAPDSKQMYLFNESLKGYINFVGQIRGKSDLTFQRFKRDYTDAIKVNIEAI